MTRTIWLGIALIIVVASVGHTSAASNAREAGTMCIRTGEELSGMLKICYYSCGGSPAAITVQPFQLCPLTIYR